MKRELKEITEEDLKDVVEFDTIVKKEKEKVLTTKVLEELYDKLSVCKYLSKGEKGEFLEEIVKYILTKWKFKFIEMKDKDMQKYWGDLIIMDSSKNVIRADVKASTTYKGRDKLSMDYEYYKKGTNIPYIPKGADNNFGYLRYLRADMIISVNADSKKLYIVKDFNKLRKKILEQMLDLELEEKNRVNNIIDISMNREDKDKDTKIVSIAFTDMKKLGVDVISYDIIEEHKKNNLCVGSTQVTV